MIKHDFETIAITTVQMTYADYVILKEFLEDIAEFNFSLDLDTIASLRRRALDALESIY